MEDSHFHFRYSFRHPHLSVIQPSSRSTFTQQTTLPYHVIPKDHIHSVGDILEPRPLSARAHSTSQLLRTVSRVAASEPTSWLLGHTYLLAHLGYP